MQEQNGQMSNEAVNEEGDEQEGNEEQTSEDVSLDNNLVDNPMETIQVRKGNWARYRARYETNYTRALKR